MKIITKTYIYHFTEQEDFDSFQVEIKYRLIDTDTDIKLGVLGFNNGNDDHNYEPDPDNWQLYSDASYGIIEEIFDRISSSDINKIGVFIDIHLDDILDEINEKTKKMQAYISNDKDKLKQLLTLLSAEFIKNEPNREFCLQNVDESITFK